MFVFTIKTLLWEKLESFTVGSEDLDYINL